MSSVTDTLTTSRRSVIRAAGVGGVAWAGLGIGVSGVAGQDDEPDYDGLLVLIYDDSPREDYTQTFPVHQEYDVPGCVAVCPGLMGTHSQWMNPGHLEEIYEAGWEVMSHTLEHRALAEIPVRGDIEEGDTDIHVQSNLHGRFSGDPLVVFDGHQEATATVAGRDTVGGDQLIVLEEPIDQSFEAGDGFETWVRYTDEFTHQILEDSKAQIEEWGFGPVTAYVHTYNRYDGYVSEAVRDHYDAVPNRHQGVFNATFDPDPFELSRANFEEGEMATEDLEEYLDVIADEPDFGILYGHSHHQGMTEERIAETIEMAQDRNIEIVTLQQALIELDVWDDEMGREPSENGENGENDDDNDDDVADNDDEVDDDDDDGNEVDVGDEDADDGDDQVVGFGVAAAVAGIGGASYWLAKRRFMTDSEE